MIRFCHYWFPVLAVVATAVAQEPSAEEMLKLLQKHSVRDEPPGNQIEPDLGDADRKKNPPALNLDFLRDRLNLNRQQHLKKIDWDFANLKIEFPEDSAWTETPLSIENVKVLVDARRELSFVMTCFPLAKDNLMSEKEIFSKMKTAHSAKLKNIQQTELAEQMGMELREGQIFSPATGRMFACFGHMVHQGGAYLIGVLGEDRKKARAEFAELTGRIEWIDPARNIRQPALLKLEVPNSGFSLDCKDAALVSANPEFPNGVAATRFSSRIEVAAIDIAGIDGDIAELSEKFIRLLAVGVEGKYDKDQSFWGKEPAMIFRSTEPVYILGSPVNWRTRFARNGEILCICMEVWSGSDENQDKVLEAVVESAAFVESQAPLLETENKESHALMALFYNEVGLGHFANGRFGSATKAFEKSFTRNPEDFTPLTNWVNSLTRQGRTAEALEVLEKHGTGFTEHQDLKLWKASLLARNQRNREAVDLYEELFKSGLREQEDILLWIQTMQALRMNDRAAEVAGQIFEENGSLVWQRILANTLWTAGKLDQSRKHYDELSKELGREPGFASDHTTLLLELQDYPAVLSTIEKSAAAGAPDANLLFNKGVALMNLGRHKEATHVLAEVDRLVPGNQAVKEYLAQAQAMLGRGTVEGVDENLAPVEIPSLLIENARQALEETDTAEKYPGEAWIVREYLQIWEWKQGTDARMTCRQVIEIADSPGIQAFSTMTVAFKGFSERVNVNTLNVFNSDGEILASLKREDMFVQDEAGALANGNKTLTVPVPSLRKGSVIEFVYTKTQLGTGERFPMTTAGIPEGGPLVYAAVAFLGDLQHVEFASTERMPASEADDMRIYEARALSKQIGTSHLPRFHQWGLLCWAADKRSSWKEEAESYLSEIQSCLDDNGFAETAVRDLRLKGKDEKEIIRTVVRWMNKNFRYEGIEFGRRARIPAAGGKTLTRGFGDCKDFSVLIRAILREVGVDAELALINSSGFVREDLPSLDQFDHMVVFLPGHGGRILDGTMSHFNTPESLPESTLGTKAFLLEANPPRFFTLEDSADTKRSVGIEKKIEIDPEDGSIKVSETVTISPETASLLRYAYSSTAEAEHVRTTENLLRQFEQRMELESVKIENLQDPFLPLVIHLRYDMSKVFRKNDNHISGTVPCPFERWLFEFSPDRGRTIPTAMFATQRLESRFELILPEGYEWLGKTAESATFDEADILTGRITRATNDRGFSLAATWETLPTSGGPELFATIQKANEKMFDELGAPVRFKKNQ